MTGKAPKKDGPHGGRPRGQHIKVWVTLEEKADIADRAAQAGMPESAYLRAVGLTQPVRSVGFGPFLHQPSHRVIASVQEAGDAGVSLRLTQAT
jgi:hypothetical protein